MKMLHDQDDSLLFQFMLAELLSANSQLSDILELVKPLERKRLAKKAKLEILHDLKEAIKLLSGTTPDYMRIFSWHVEYGTLMKFKHYLGLLTFEDEIAKVEKHGSRTWVLCMECLDSIHEQKMDNLLLLIEKLRKAFGQLIRETAKLILEFSKNENVLYFLLRHQEQISTMYGPKFLGNLMDAAHPKGRKGCCTLLLNRYQKRGFDHLLPKIEEAFVQL